MIFKSGNASRAHSPYFQYVPLDLPKGCKFAPRCKYATDKCREMEPELNEVEPGHMVRCFYPKKGERN